MQTIPIVDVALRYLERRWSVIPVRPRDKRPLVRWQIYQHQCAGDSDVRQWFGQWPDANVGVVTGAISGLVVMDVDPKHGGEQSLANLEREHGPLPQTVECTTGGGGRHLYFAHPGGVVHNKVGLASGIDIRGDGGYVVAPPSCHASGAAYCWRDGHAPDECRAAELPDWLQRELTGSRRRAGHSVAHWQQLVREGVGEGERNNTIASFSGHLLWHGVDPDVVQELLLCWNAIRARPPLPDDEVIRTVESITHLHERRDAED
ncbi:MAG: bifunctional DNA primase/polymerase [Pseudomonadota bacterium]|nr:MAG: bifunctional DNA primase/polymerase [Pseudomonadota bacterium]